jgi:hypothetical protein
MGAEFSVKNVRTQSRVYKNFEVVFFKNRHVSSERKELRG